MVGKITDSFSQLPASQMLDSLIDQAIDSGASYIHVEPGDVEVLVRYRVNGSLIEINRFSKKRFDSFIDRLKKLANLETRVRNIPQDGKFKVSSNSEAYTLRVSILPTVDGEKVSINVLNSSKHTPSLKELGYWGHGLAAVNESLCRKNGLILLVGPRDSGKSLSLVSMLSNVKDPNLKIASIEDPIEYVISNANQVQVNYKTKLTLSLGLKTLAKHDNDIIMVSEIRDPESADLTFHYASHGKLLLGTIYANNFYSALDKLNDMGVSHAMATHSLKLVSNQRLVRRLCVSCRDNVEPDKPSLSLLEEIFNFSNPQSMKLIHKLESEYVSQISNDNKGILSKDLGTSETRIKRIWKAHEGGCENCLHTGYRGRVGLYEVIVITPQIQKLIMSLASPKVISAKASAEGSVSLLTDGLIKALQGYTSINEVFRLYQETF
jgi:type IV pilus assembly protein PilB